MISEEELIYTSKISADFAKLLQLAPTHTTLYDTLRWATDNGIPIFSIHKDAIKDVPQSSHWERVIRFSRDNIPNEKLTWIQEYDTIAQILEDHGIAICLTKTFGPFPFWSGNVDAIVDESNFVQGLHILEDYGYVRLPWCDEPHKVLLKNFKNGRNVISLHLHSRIAWNATYLHSFTAMKNSKTKEEFKPRRFLGDDALLATILAHAFSENRCIRAIDLLIANEICNNDDIVAGARGLAESEGWEREFSLSLNSFIIAARNISRKRRSELFKNITQQRNAHANRALDAFFLKSLNESNNLPMKLPISLTKGLLFRRLLLYDENRHSLQGVKKTTDMMRNYIIRKLGNQRIKGKSIAISGPDGSGKTTLASEIHNALKEMGIKSKITWSRYGTVPPKIYEVFQRNKVTYKKRNNSMNKRRDSGKPDLRLTENIIRLSIHSFFSNLLGTNVIFDRHFLDSEVDYYIDSSKSSNWLVRIGRTIMRRPDLSIFLISDPETLSERSDELISNLERKLAAYDMILRKGNYQSLIVRAEKNLGKIIDDLIPKIVQGISIEKG